MKWMPDTILSASLCASLFVGVLVFAPTMAAWAQDAVGDKQIPGAAASIVEEDIEYSPEEQIVHVGQAIRVENKDPFEHKSRVTLQKQDGGLGHIALKDHVDKPGSVYTFTLDTPGNYEIRCLLHDGMTAMIKAVK
ncbi:MAG: hypothetical protein R8K53_02815 [Mariprofundaceae bacterium]